MGVTTALNSSGLSYVWPLVPWLRPKLILTMQHMAMLVFQSLVPMVLVFMVLVFMVLVLMVLVFMVLVFMVLVLMVPTELIPMALAMPLVTPVLAHLPL